MKALTIAITAIYLLLEACSALLGAGVYFTPQSPDSLTGAEKLGYVTTSFGISWLLVLWVHKKTSSAAVFFVFPVLFILSVHGVHKLMDEIPKHLPNQALQASIPTGTNILANQNIEALISIYSLSTPLSVNYNDADLDVFLSTYGGSDPQLQEWLIAGIEQAGLFSIYWETMSKTLNKGKLESEISMLRKLIAERFAYHRYKYGEVSQIRYPDALFRLPIDSDSLIASILNKETHWDERSATWMRLTQNFEFLQQRPPNHNSWAEEYRKSLSASALRNYPSVVNVLIPWNNMDLFNANYEIALREIVPYFFINNRPILDLSLLRSYHSRALFIEELNQGISPQLKTIMVNYQKNNLKELNQTTNAWENEFKSAPGYVLARVVWILPWLVVFSYVLLGVNAWKLSGNTSAYRPAVFVVILFASLSLAWSLTSSEVGMNHLMTVAELLGPKESLLKFIN